jgi:hypothetical protein
MTLGILATCDDPSNPFSNNLGEKVVVEPPTINVTSPDQGGFIRGTVTITGKAKAYIEVKKIEVHIFANEMFDQQEIPWTNALTWKDENGAKVTSTIKMGGSLKEKTWSLVFDTTKFNKGNDGFIQMEFRVHDTKAVEPSIKYTYVIKNNPSSIKMANPSEVEILDPNIEVSRINWGGDIRGQVIDLKGIRPGYPQIQIWPHDDPSCPNENDPDSLAADPSHPEWGWGSLFLTGDGYDTIDAMGADGKLGVYVDRMKMRVVTASPFGFKLAEWTIDPPDPLNPDLRRIRYIPDGNGKAQPLTAGKKYNFRIRTKDTPSDAAKGMIPCDPDPADPTPFLEGFFPPLNFGGIPTKEPVDNFTYRGEPIRIVIFSSDSRPTIELNNDDLANYPAAGLTGPGHFNNDPITATPDSSGNVTTNANVILSKIENKPNYYISEPTSRKIDRKTPTDPDFRLRLLIVQPNGVSKVTLTCLHESSGKSLLLDPWVGVPVDPTPPPTGPDLSKGNYYTFTADGTYTAPNSKGITEEMFTTSSAPYTLTVTVYATDNTETKQRYTLYMDGEGPNVNISSVRGAFTDAKKDEITGSTGSLINPGPYTVNGNIQVAVDRTDISGIMAYRDGMGTPPPVGNAEIYNYPMVKWIVEKVDPLSLAAPKSAAGSGTILEELEKFKNDPTPENLKFFYNIKDMIPPDTHLESGWVKQPLPVGDRKVEEDKAHHFKLNTENFDGQDLWLYVIAQDQVQNLGYVVQKIHVDKETDKPVINIPTLYEYNASDTPQLIAGPNDLDVDVVDKDKDSLWTGNYSTSRPRRNVLGLGEGIQLNITDDDGIDLKFKNGAPNGVEITLKDLTTNISGTLSEAQVRTALGQAAYGTKNVFRDMSGTLSQDIMARALNKQLPELPPDGAKKLTLKDGMYELTITVKDAVSEKVAISPYRITGDTPEEASSGIKKYYFAVFTELPEIEIKNPAENAWGSGIPIDIYGTVKSRLDVRQLWITFTPDVTLTAGPDFLSHTEPLDLFADAAYTSKVTATPDADGYYKYYWKKDAVKFQQTGIPPGQRRFNVEACDRLGNMDNVVRTLQSDVFAPDVTLIEFNNGRPYETVQYLYGKVAFVVSASDDNAMYESKVNGVDMSGIKWWVLPETAPDPTWDTAFNTMGFEMGGNFPLNQEKNGRYTGIIDTRKITLTTSDPVKYKLCILAMDTAGNTSSREVTVSGSKTNVNWYETFIVDQSKDKPDIDETSLDPKDNVKDGKVVITGTVSDADLFNPANRNTYVQIRFPAMPLNPTTGLPATWRDWISVNIPATYTSGGGGIDPSGYIAFKFDVYALSDKNDPASFIYKGADAADARDYLSKDGIKYYQIQVTDEAVGPTDAEKTAGAKWYGKNPDLFMVSNPVYPGYVYTPAVAVSKIFPNDTDGYRFIVDATFPEIFFDKYDPTKEITRPDGTISNHPNHTTFRPTYSTYEDLINDLSGKVEEYKLNTFILSWSVKGVTKTRIIKNNPPDEVPAGTYHWDLQALLLDADFRQFFNDAEQGLQIIVFEATDMVSKTSRVSWNFSKDTQGPDIIFNNIARAIKRDTSFAEPFPTGTNAWPSDWRYGPNWKSAWTPAWQAIIKDWPSEYAFKIAADIITALNDENSRSPSTVIGDASTTPVIKGSFSDQYSSVRKLLPDGSPDQTFFYYRFKDKAGVVQDIPTPENKLNTVVIDGGTWLEKLVEPPAGSGQNARSADWEITLDKANGFGGPDGENWLDIRIEDTAGNISEIFNVRFLVDREPPILADEFEVISLGGAAPPKTVLTENERVFSAAAWTTNATDTTEAFKLQGTVSDATLKNLQITIGQEGFAAYTVIASVGIDIDSAGAWVYTNPDDQVVRNGTSSDDTAQKRLTLTEVTGSVPPEWTWTLTVQKKDIYELRNIPGSSNSTRRYIRVSATDKANKRAGPVDWYFYLDDKKPTIEYTNLDKATATVPPEGSSFENNVGLSILVADETKVKDVQYMIGKWDYAGVGSWKWYDGSGWTLSSPPSPPTSWPSAFTSDTSPTRSTTMNVTIDQKVIDAANTKTPNTFPDTPKLFEQEGRYRLDLYVTDFSLGNGNPHKTWHSGDTFMDTTNTDGQKSGRVFLFDKKDPTLEWEDAADKTYFRNDGGKVTFKFIAGDGNTIQRWEAVVRDENGIVENSAGTIKWESGTTPGISQAIPLPSTVSPSPAGDIDNKTSIEDRHFEITPYMTTNAAASGGTALDLDSVINPDGLPKTFTITITVWDGAKRSNSITKSFNLDNKPPEFIQDKFNPASFDIAPAKKDTWDAVTGRLNIRGNSTDNSNQIKRVAFYIPPTGAGFSGNFPDPKTINDATSATDGWHWHDPAYPGSFAIKSGDTTLLQIEEGTFAWRIIVPQTSLFLSDPVAKNYVQITKTGGISINGDPAVPPGSYRDVDPTTFATSTENVPALTSPELNNKYDPTNPKKIFGNEEVGLITVYMLVEDMAGNVAYDVLKYWIWPAGDRPTVISINNPDSTKIQAERLLNGTIRLSGMAKDNEQVKYVWFRVLRVTYDAAGNQIIGAPYELTIPRWNEETWEAVTTAPLNQSPVNDALRLGSRRNDDEPAASDTGGWYMANGGNAKDVSWWAYINSDGKLDPAGLDATEIRIEVRAQDVTWDDSKNEWMKYSDTAGGYRGFASTPLAVHAWVVANAPVFETPPMVAKGTSEDADDPLKTDVIWTSIDNASIRNRSSYKVTVKHTTGLSAIRWSPTAWSTTLNSGAGGFQSNPLADAYNLLNPDADGKYVYFDGNTAKVDTRSAVFGFLTAATPRTGSTPGTGPRMAVTVKARGTLGPGTVTLNKDRKYMVWKWDTTLAIETSGAFPHETGTPPTHDSTHFSVINGVQVHKDMRNSVFSPKTTGSYNIGDAILIESEPDPAPASQTIQYFKWDVIVDVRADLLLSDLPDSYGPPNVGQTKNSVFYPVYLSASEVSRSTPLTTRGDALLPIDNLKPYAMYTLNRKAAGQAATIGGEAGDDGPVNGVAKVVLWFSRMNAAGTAREFISWHEQKEGTTTPLPAAGFTDVSLDATGGAGWWDDDGVIKAWNTANPTKPQVKKPYIPAEATTEADALDGVGASAIVIDRNSPSVGQAAYGHKLPMGFANGGMGKIWYVEINTFGIKSGPVTLHYVVIDKAGNARYYSEPLVIMNNAPVISQIKLATDIRDNSEFKTKWTTPARVGNGSTTMPTTPSGTETNGRNQILQYIWDRVPLGTTDVQKGITEYIYSNDLTVNKVIDFNVRNKLLAVRIETTNGPGSGKTRNFRLEYVSNAALLANTLKPDGTPDKTELPNMKAGRVYIINNPGSARWGAIGAEGDGPWPKGYAFIAAVDGTNEDNEPRIDGTGSVWELNSAYYSTGTRTLPTNLNLLDVEYEKNNSGINADAVSAEFVYNSSAFGAAAGSTIVDYTNTTDAYPPADGTDAAMTQALLGNSMFILRVFDGDERDQFGDFAIIRIRVNNDDKTKPFAQLYDLNPMTEGVDRAQSRQRSLTPMFIGEGGNSNRTKGGLWNTDAANRSISKPGHIEPRSMATGYGNAATGNLYTTIQGQESAARNHSLSSAQMGGAATKAAATVQKPWADPAGYFAMDTVSGQVVLRGYVEDNERIDQVDLLISTSTNTNPTPIPILTSYNNQAENTTPGATGYGQTGNSSSYIPPRTGLLQIGPNTATTPTADAAGNPRVYFTDTIDLYRHRVEWAYVWDTESIPANTVVDSNITVRVRASNRGAVAANKQSDNTPAPGTVHVNTSEPTKPNTSPTNPGFPQGLNKYNSIPVNIRPFITGFKRDTSKFFHNNRSMQGWTAFARGEEVVVEGLNLGRTGLTTNISFPDQANMAANAVTAAQQTNFELASTAVSRYRSFTIPANGNAKPGTVTLTAGTFQAVNTGTERPQVSGAFVIQPWNIEYSPSIDGSQLWDDTRSVHIWQSNNTQTGNDRASFRVTNLTSTPWYIMNPAMSIDPRDGTLHASHNEGGMPGNSEASNTGNTYRSTNNSDGNNGNPIRLAGFRDPILFSDIYFSPGGATNNNSAEAWVAFSIIGRSGTSQNWDGLGGLYMHGPNGADPRLIAGMGGSTHYLAEGTYYNASNNNPGAVAQPPSTDQFMNPHIVTYATGQQNEHIHVSYYDSKDGSIKYRYNRRGTPGTVNGTGAAYGWTNLDGGVDADDQTALGVAAPFDPGVAANGRIVNYKDSLDGTRTNRREPGTTVDVDAGRHNSIAVNASGHPYVAYFDETNQKLKLAVSNSTTPYAAANWKIINNIIPTTNMSHKGTGQFVSMRIDTRSGTNPTLNKVHIAALNSVNKQLVYVSGYVNFAAGTFTGTSGGTDAPVVQVVDSVGMVGRWSSLSLDVNGNPWISYQDESNIGSMDGVKMAFFDATKYKKDAKDIYGASVNGWETMHVPAQYRVENPIDSGREHGRLGMECFPTRNYQTTNTKFWAGAVSYRAPDLYRIAYYIKP